MNLPAAPQATGPLVLVVEDEPGIATILSAYLQRDGLRAHQAHDGLEALRLFRQLKPDMVLLDIHLPGMDGLDLLRAIREDGQTPVIMVTALADDVDKLVGLRLGADDYVVKPFSPPEVVARVRAVLRRVQAQPSAPARAAQRIRVGRIEIDQEAHAAFAHGDDGRAVPLPLTLTEYRLLACLAAQPRRCFSRSHLIEHCLPESDALDRVIDSHLSKLRRKLQQAGQGELIETVRGIGYRLWPGEGPVA
ncbi:DNA-binding response regulator [Paracidovorax avenae]|uniref:Two component transcriptional regulator, winged helix family n=1 Tax=Paracidovorax avenae (strain ATCC 19860 / DSM 7227 / CCUG 15838 / JCM 20985 / LMG 2117 / NCPPB 1011) TaxID=643561 RepID=F0Q627_PARA1|nr:MULTISPECIES: response regulator [Comamonadaceae]ADX48108.1 two component transcriptional regulator, winged helix family [Paracidovorax avenae ATCC 19860]AVS63499.1 DNA-binding response regulator [Paracidovorax avenae]AVS65787.1 DNA-binding response regulator [Paracidovorax avenae]AVS72030.1 DNA-binding response regulator [Paracidovorax avenae]AVS86152.1 DNA-binding response regulator [Paracidovorax avenae]